MKKLACPMVLFGCCLIVALAPYATQAAEELGIDRSNLTRESEATRVKTIEGIRALHAVWFRDVLKTSTPQSIADFVDEVKLAKQNNLKMLVNVLTSYADYDLASFANAGEEFRKRCGWSEGSGKLSRVNFIAVLNGPGL